MPILSTAKPMPPSRMSARPTKVIGHRGASNLAPENTLAAFELAFMLTLDGVELDIQRSVDGELIVFHDEDLSRTTNGTGWVGEKTLAELQTLDAGGWFDLRYEGESIPTLSEVFELMRVNEMTLFLELKDPHFYPDIEIEVANIIREYQFENRVQVRSFDHEALKTFHHIAPEIPISELWWEKLPSENETFTRTINALYTLYTPETLAQIHERGQQATAWTVNNLEAAKRLITWGIDAITTDNPDQVKKLFSPNKPR